MNALASRLTRLHRQAGASASSLLPTAAAAARHDQHAGGDASSPEAASASDATSRIESLRRLLAMHGARYAPSPAALDRVLPGDEIAPGLRCHEHAVPWLRAPATLCVQALSRDPVPEPELDPARLKFFDTETTGLAGGTGTRAFQIGVGDWHEGIFRLRQLTLTTLAGEAAMLDRFACWLGPDDVLVSYNGKSYDAPLLATRYRLARRASPLAGLRHLDLLYPVRRRYRGQWANCRLATVERELLGVVREHDLPGSEAPRAWLEFRRGGSAVDLRRVAEHNRQDLRSLALLLCRLTEGAAVVPGG